MNKANTSDVRRYTNLPEVIHIVRTRKLYLLNPTGWEDKNDTKYIEAFQNRTGRQSVRVLCFTKSKEEYHHWRTFAQGPAGACIVFNYRELAEHLRTRDVLFRDVVYPFLKDLQTRPPLTEDLPFTKRVAFDTENEVRAFYSSPGKVPDPLPIEIPLNLIKQVTLSPWLPQSLFDSVRKALDPIELVTHSKLLDNATWKGIPDHDFAPQK